MNYQLQVTAHDRPAMPERLLRVIRHRGFKLTKMNLNADAQHGRVSICLTVSGDRPVRLLETQLSKLVDVSEVVLNPSADAAIAALG